MKTICTGISPDFVQKWTAEQAIREIVQNYLDSRSEFGCDGKILWNKGQTRIRDHGPGLKMKHLALGVSDKSEESIGIFGKGLKQALLVLTREKRNAAVYSNGIAIIPTIDYNKDYETEMLHFTIEKTNGRLKDIQGTLIAFDCSKEELESGKKYFMKFNRPKSLDGRIMLPGGNVFVNGSLVGTIDDAMFSYSLDHKNANTVMSSDRDMVNKDALRMVARDFISETNSRKVAELCLVNMVRSTDKVYDFERSIGAWHWQLKKPIWRYAINKVLGKTAVINDSDKAAAQAKYLGFTPFDAPSMWREALKFCGVKTAVEVLTEAAQKKPPYICESQLSELEKINLSRAIALVSNNYASCGTVKVVDSLNYFMGVPESSDRRLNGAYCRRTDEILIVRRELDTLAGTTRIILHETVHKVSGHGDCSAEFEEALTNAATHVLLLSN